MISRTHHWLCSALLVMTVPAYGEYPQSDDPVFERISQADNIYICSEIDELDAETLQAFVSNQAANKQPNISDGISTRSDTKGSEVLFVALDTDSTPNPQLTKCLTNFQDVRGDILDETIRQSQVVGGREIAEGVSLPEGYAPVKEHWGFDRQSDWLIVYFAADEGAPSLPDKAMTGLFGLNISACQINPACDSCVRE